MRGKQPTIFFLINFSKNSIQVQTQSQTCTCVQRKKNLIQFIAYSEDMHMRRRRELFWPVIMADLLHGEISAQISVLNSQKPWPLHVKYICIFTLLQFIRLPPFANKYELPTGFQTSQIEKQTFHSTKELKRRVHIFFAHVHLAILLHLPLVVSDSQVVAGSGSR